MSYEKNLGRVKGEQGVAFYPTATIREDRVVINWHCTEDNYSGTLPQSTTIIPMVYYPHYDSETGLLSWTKRQDEGLPSAMLIKGDKGDPGSVQLDNEFVDELPNVANAKESVLYFKAIGPEKYKTYIYDAEKNDFVDLGLSSLDLENYYTKTEINNLFNTVYTKEAIDALIGHVMELQEEILSIL